MAALVSLVPVRDIPVVPAMNRRPHLRLAWRRPEVEGRLRSSWHRAPDGRLVCAWQLPAEPAPLT